MAKEYSYAIDRSKAVAATETALKGGLRGR